MSTPTADDLPDVPNPPYWLSCEASRIRWIENHLIMLRRNYRINDLGQSRMACRDYPDIYRDVAERDMQFKLRR